MAAAASSSGRTWSRPCLLANAWDLQPRVEANLDGPTIQPHRRSSFITKWEWVTTLLLRALATTWAQVRASRLVFGGKGKVKDKGKDEDKGKDKGTGKDSDKGRQKGDKGAKAHAKG